MPKHIYLYVLLIAAMPLCGCQAGDRVSSASASQLPPLQAPGKVANNVAQALRSWRNVKPICGTVTPEERPEALIIAPAAKCLGCDDVAYVLRWVRRETGAGRNTWFVTAGDRMDDVCKYVRGERVDRRMPVVKVGDQMLPDRSLSDLLYVALTPEGDVARVLNAPSGGDLVRVIESTDSAHLVYREDGGAQ